MGNVYKESLPQTYVEGYHDLETILAMEYRPLGKTNLLISKLSYGGGPLGNHYGTYDQDDAVAAVRLAVQQGVNYIDTAPWYGQGQSEKTIGEALKEIPREAYYIATKVGRYELDFKNMFDFSVEKTIASVNKSLKLLGVNCIDVIQVHDIEFAPSLDIIITQTLPALSRLVADGKVKHIGITGYPISVLKECVDRSNIDISCILTYSRYTLIDDTLSKYIQFFKGKNISIINASLLSMGLLTAKGPPAWHPASSDVKETCVAAAKYCEEKGTRLSKLAIWYAMQCKDVCTNLIGIQNLEELRESLHILQNGITEEEKVVLREVEERYLSAIKCKHWENIEIDRYWNALKGKK